MTMKPIKLARPTTPADDVVVVRTSSTDVAVDVAVDAAVDVAVDVAVEERPLRARFVVLDDGPSPPTGVVVYEAKDPGQAVDTAIARGDPAPYGAVLWDSATALARRLFRAELQGRRVLELGCGCGLVGVVCATRGAIVLCTDVDVHTLVATRRAATDAAVADRLSTAVFDLCGAAPLPLVDAAPATDVIIADVLYEPMLAAAAARRTLEALAMGARVFIGDPDRAGRQTLLRLLREAGVGGELGPTFDDCVCVLQPIGGG